MPRRTSRSSRRTSSTSTLDSHPGEPALLAELAAASDWEKTELAVDVGGEDVVVGDGRGSAIVAVVVIADDGREREGLVLVSGYILTFSGEAGVGGMGTLAGRCDEASTFGIASSAMEDEGICVGRPGALSEVEGPLATALWMSFSRSSTLSIRRSGAGDSVLNDVDSFGC